MTETAHSTHAPATPIPATASALAPAILAILLGMFLLYGTGIVQAQALHDAAHDSRHSFAFPCH